VNQGRDHCSLPKAKAYKFYYFFTAYFLFFLPIGFPKRKNVRRRRCQIYLNFLSNKISNPKSSKHSKFLEIFGSVFGCGIPRETLLKTEKTNFFISGQICSQKINNTKKRCRNHTLFVFSKNIVILSFAFCYLFCPNIIFIFYFNFFF
jgi:hypothetical protein